MSDDYEAACGSEEKVALMRSVEEHFGAGVNQR